ncbi:MAG: PA14 domain-containing protein [Microthrixaceae bacterium]
MKQTELFMEPKWFRAPGGGWAEVDPKLEVAAGAKDGRVSAVGVGFSATFGPSGEGVSLGFEGRELRFVPRGRSDVAPELDGKDPAVLWYRGIAPGVDLRYRVTATGLKEDFVVANADGFADPSVFVTDIESEGALIADPERPGSLVLDWDGDGRSAWAGDDDGPKVRIPEPVVSNTTGRGLGQLKPSLALDDEAERARPGERRRRPVGVLFDVAAAQRLSADQFPVVVDPSVEIIPASMGGTWSSHNQAGNLTTGTSQWPLMGDWRIFGATDYWRSNVNMGYSHLWTSLAPNPKVFSAVVKLQTVEYPAPAAPTFDTSWSLFPTSPNDALIRACHSSAVSYAGAYPGVDAAKCRDSYYFGYSLTDSVLGAHSGTTYVDVSDMVRPWVAAKDGAQRIGLSVAPQSGVYNFKATAPTMLVTWDQQTPTTTPVTPTDGQTILSTTPTLQVNAVTDPDAGQNPPLYRAMVWAAKPSAIAQDDPVAQCAADSAVWSSSWQSNTPSFAVPDGVLADGTTYYWTIASFGNTYPGYPTCSGPWSFKVDRRLGTSGPFPTQELGPVTVNMATGNVVTSAGSHSVSTVGGSISADLVYNSQASTNQGLRAEYFGGTHPTARLSPSINAMLNDPPFSQRVDQKIEFDWGLGGPTSNGNALDNFVARWTGYVTVPTAGSYCFGTKADDGSRVYINNSLVMNNWVDQMPTDKSCTTAVSFAAGETKHIRVEYYDRTAGASMALKVFGGPTGTMVVPTGWLSTEPNLLGPGWSFNAGDVAVAGARVTGSGVTLTMGDGSTVEYKKSASGAFVGPNQDATSVSVDPVTNRVSVTDDGGTSYTYDADGLLLSAVSAPDDRSPASTVMEWTGTPAKLTAMKDPVANDTVTLAYGGSTSCASPPSGFAIAPGQLCKVSSWDGAVTDLFYDSGRRLSRIVTPGGARTDYVYDSANRVTSITDVAANDAVADGVRAADASITWQIAYTSGKATSVTAPAPTAGAARQTATINYDSQPAGAGLGDTRVTLSGLAAPLGFTEKARWDSSYRERETIDSSGSITRIAYDGTSDRVSYADTDADTVYALRTSTIYDTSVVFNQLARPVAEHGPAPVSLFTGATPNVGAQVPTTLTAYDENINGLAAAWWNDAPGSGETYTYPKRPSFRGAPKLHTLLTGSANWNWTSSSPSSTLLGTDNFSGRLTGLVYLANAGNWRFAAQGDDGVRLTIDDHLAVDGWLTPTTKKTSALINLAAGWHRISVDFREDAGGASLQLWYTPPSGSETIIPAASLKPDLGLVTSSVQEDGKVTTTSYANPILGLETASTLDPTGVNLSTTTTYETSGTNKFHRRLSRALPAASAAGLEPLTYTHYGPTETAPSVTCAGSGVTVASVGQRGLAKTSRMADPDTHGGTGGIVRQQVHDSTGRIVATRVSTDAKWSCTQLDSRGRATKQTFAAFGGEPERTVTTSHKVGGDPFLTSVTDDSLPSGADTIRTRVDLLGRVTDYVDVWGTYTHIDYDVANRVTQTTVFRMSGGTGTVSEAVMTDYTTTGSAVNSQSATRWSNAVSPVSGYNTSTLTATTAMPTAAGTTLAAISHDAAGRVAYVDYSNGVRSTNAYDLFGRDAGVTHAKGATVLTSEAVTRDLPGRIVDRTVDGIDANPGGVNYTYDGAGRLVDWWETDPSTSTQYHGTYTFGAAPTECSTGSWGNATNAGRNSNRATSTVQVNGGATATTKYCYDFADRIQRVLTPSGTANPYASGFVYDAHGNTTGLGDQVHTYDSADRHMSTGPAGPRNAVLVVGNPGSLSNRDTWMRDRLQAGGWSVSIVDDDAVGSGTATGKQLVAMSESVGGTGGNSAGTALSSVAVPVISAESFVFDELGMTGTGSNQGSTGTQNSVDVTAAGQSHPLGAGFAQGNLVTSTSAVMTHGWGKPNSNAVVAATIAAQPTQATIFGYDTGASMVSGTAPARRVGFMYYGGNGQTSFNDNATALFDASVAWATATAPKVAYKRDATDRITERSANGRVVARYSYTASGDTSDLTLDANNTVVEATLSLPGGALYTWRSAAPVWSYSNTHGDVVVTTDTAGVKQGPTRAYDPYGQPLTTAAEIDNSRGEFDYGWLGEHQRPLEHQTGAIPIIEMGARQYDPFLGRFIEVDPIEGGLPSNDYGYVLDPMNQKDLDGNGGPCSLSVRNPRAWNACSLRRARARGSKWVRVGLFRTQHVKVWRTAIGGNRYQTTRQVKVLYSTKKISIRLRDPVAYSWWNSRLLLIPFSLLDPKFQVPSCSDVPLMCRRRSRETY